MVLFEGTNIIETHIAQKVLCPTWNSGSAIHGLHNTTGTIAHVVTGLDGIVRKPGKFELKTGMNLKDLILEAGGVDEDVYRYRIEVARINPNMSSEDNYAEIIYLDIHIYQKHYYLLDEISLL